MLGATFKDANEGDKVRVLICEGEEQIQVKGVLKKEEEVIITSGKKVHLRDGDILLNAKQQNPKRSWNILSILLVVA